MVAGFTRSFGQKIPSLVPAAAASCSQAKGEDTKQVRIFNMVPFKIYQKKEKNGRIFSQLFAQRAEWLKPVMFTAGVGLLDDQHKCKGDPEKGMLVCKIGGPAYRIGTYK